MCLESVASYFKLIIKKTNKKYGGDLGSFKVGLLEVSKEFLDVIETSTKRIVQNSREIFKPMLVLPLSNLENLDVFVLSIGGFGCEGSQQSLWGYPGLRVRDAPLQGRLSHLL